MILNHISNQVKSSLPTTVIGCLTAPSHTLLKGASRITPEGGEPMKNVDLTSTEVAAMVS